MILTEEEIRILAALYITKIKSEFDLCIDALQEYDFDKSRNAIINYMTYFNRIKELVVYKEKIEREEENDKKICM